MFAWIAPFRHERRALWLGALLAPLLACAGDGLGAKEDSAQGGAGGLMGQGGQSGGDQAGGGNTNQGGQLGGSSGSGGTGGSGGAGGSASGGAGGTAGMSGAGGMAGGVGGSSMGGSGMTSGCAGATFCSDFEADSLPQGVTFFPDYQRANMANFVTVDSSASKSGTRSLKVKGTDFSQMLGVAAPGNKFWVRFHLRSDTDIQQGHNTYVAAVEGSGDPNMGQAVRIGEHQCQLELNRKSDDKELLSNGGQYACSGGIKLVASQWYCMEALFDGAAGEVRVFVDKQEVEALHATGWGPYDYKLFKFGFEKYHGQAKTLWYDDVAVGRERIGCP